MVRAARNLGEGRNVTFENFIKGQLMGVAIREGMRHGGYHNALAVAQVIANRVRAGWEGGDWLRVMVTAPDYMGTIYDLMPTIAPRDISFRTVLQRIDDIYTGIAQDTMTEGALYYCELHRVNRQWFQENVLSDPAAHPRLATVGPVTFFG
jgi:hypothetical protein